MLSVKLDKMCFMMLTGKKKKKNAYLYIENGAVLFL